MLGLVRQEVSAIIMTISERGHCSSRFLPCGGRKGTEDRRNGVSTGGGYGGGRGGGGQGEVVVEVEEEEGRGYNKGLGPEKKNGENGNG